MWMYDAHIWKIRERKAIRQHKDTPQNRSILFWLTRYSSSSTARYCPRFFLIKLGVKPRLHTLKISIFSINPVFVRPNKTMNNPLNVCKICTFKVIFSSSKIKRTFLIFFLQIIFNYEINFYKWNFFKLWFLKHVLCFLKMCSIFVGFVHKFGRPDNDII